MSPQFQLETRLLLACSRVQLSSSMTESIKHLVNQNLDWDYLTEAASWHRVLPLLCYNLQRVCADSVPSTSLHELQAAFQLNSAHNLFLAAELIKILQCLEGQGIPALAFKGPSLAAVAYGNLALRQFCDLDVLVKNRDFPHAKKLFLAQGYRPWQELTVEEEEDHFRLNHAYTLVREHDGLSLDLHWKLTQERYAFGLDIDSMWGRTTQRMFGGREISSLSAEDLLAVLCLHGSKHFWERLGWVCDVAELIRANPQLRWGEILNRSDALQISRAVLLGVDLAKNLLDAHLPEQVLSTIGRDPAVRWVSSLIRGRLFARTRRAGPVESAALFFLMREGLRNKLPHLAYSFRRVVTPNVADTNAYALPGSLQFLYYPLRALRLTRATIGRLLSRTI